MTAPIIKALQARLDAWMAAQGDRGQPTEMEAKEHQHSGNIKDADQPKKKNGKKK